MLPWSLWAKNIFSEFLENFQVKFFSNKIKVFLETTFVHVSCYSDHYELKIFFRFSKSATTLRYTNLDSRFPPWNAILEARPPLCNTSSEAGALDTGGTYRESRMTRTKNFLSQSFSENHFSPRFMLPWSLVAKNIFFELVKNENFEYVINENCPICITKIGKKWKFWLRNQRPNPPPPPRNQP